MFTNTENNITNDDRYKQSKTQNKNKFIPQIRSKTDYNTRINNNNEGPKTENNKFKTKNEVHSIPNTSCNNGGTKINNSRSNKSNGYYNGKDIKEFWRNGIVQPLANDGLYQIGGHAILNGKRIVSANNKEISNNGLSRAIDHYLLNSF